MILIPFQLLEWEEKIVTEATMPRALHENVESGHLGI